MMQTEVLPDKLNKSQVLHDEHWRSLPSFYALSQPTVCTDDPATEQQICYCALPSIGSA